MEEVGGSIGILVAQHTRMKEKKKEGDMTKKTPRCLWVCKRPSFGLTWDVVTESRVDAGNKGEKGILRRFELPGPQ